MDKTYKAYLGADYSPTQGSPTSLVVQNNTSFAADDLIVFGEPSEEYTELKRITAISGSTIFTLASALTFAHNKGAPAYKSLWDQVSIEGRSSSAGVFAELTATAIQWDSKTNETIYFHSDGTDTWEYRFRFKNTVSTTYSDYSPTLTGSGFTENQVGFMIRTVREIVGDKTRRIVQDDEIIRYFNRAQNIIYAHNPKYYFLKVDTYKSGTGISVLASTTDYALSDYSNFGHLAYIRFKYTSGATNIIYPIKGTSDLEFDSLTSDLNRGTDDFGTSFKLLPPDANSANGYIVLNPIPTNSNLATIYPVYYKKMDRLNSVDDETSVPIPSLLEDFAIAMVEKTKGNEKKSALYMEMFLGPADLREGYDQITGIKLLDQLDAAQKNPSGQPRSLSNFRGRRAVARSYGSGRRINADYYREFIDDGDYD